MGSRQRVVDVAKARGRTVTNDVLRELRDARLDRNLTHAALGRTLGMSRSQYSRIERGVTEGITIEQAVVLLAAVGLDLSVRAYPSGEPLRDAAHAALIGRFRALVDPSIRVLTEVPLPLSGDRRAWDVVVVGSDWRHGIEAETRPRDLQALERRLSLKVRDGDVHAASLLLLDSRHNRAFVRANAESLATHFPLTQRDAIDAFRKGSNPGAGAVLLL